MIDEYIRYIKDVRRYSERTAQIYRSVLEEYFAFAEGLSAIELRTYVVHLLDDKKESARTVNLHLSVISGYCKFLMKTGELKSNPVRLVTRPKHRKGSRSSTGRMPSPDGSSRTKARWSLAATRASSAT